MEVGLTTNGVLLDKLEHHKNLTWCRISSSDDRTPNYEAIERALKTNPETDWAFAHVVTRNPNYDTIRDINSLANIFKFSHVKIHPDLFDIDNVPMGEVKKFLKTKGRRVIYQDRENITEGTKDCYIG